MNNAVLRKLGWIGLGGLLVVNLIQSALLPAGHALGLAMLLVFPAAVLFVSMLLMPRETATVLRYKDLLIPLVLLLLVKRLVSVLAVIPILGVLFTQSVPLAAVGVGVTLSLSVAIHFLLGVAYSAWTTGVIMDFFRWGEADPCGVFHPAMTRFWRFFGVELIAWIAVIVALFIGLLLLPVFPVAFLGLFIFTILFNARTAAVLPVAWLENGSFGTVFRRGMEVSRAHWREWRLLSVAQLFLLGLVIFYFAHVVTQTGIGSTDNTSVGWNVSILWIGGYVNDQRWYEAWAKAWNQPMLPLVETVLTLLFGAMAVAIKIAIVQRANLVPDWGLGYQAAEDPSKEEQQGRY